MDKKVKVTANLTEANKKFEDATEKFRHSVTVLKNLNNKMEWIK